VIRWRNWWGIVVDAFTFKVISELKSDGWKIITIHPLKIARNGTVLDQAEALDVFDRLSADNSGKDDVEKKTSRR